MKYEVLIMPSSKRRIFGFLSVRRKQPVSGITALWMRFSRWKHSLSVCPRAPESDAFDCEVRQLLYGKRQHAYRILFDISGETV